MWVRSLTVSECFDVLGAHRFAHLACAKEGRPYVVPIYYAYSEKALYAFSLPGTIEWMRRTRACRHLWSEATGSWLDSVIADRWDEGLPEGIGDKRQGTTLVAA
jgi:uncharacterized protein